MKASYHNTVQVNIVKETASVKYAKNDPPIDDYDIISIDIIDDKGEKHSITIFGTGGVPIKRSRIKNFL